MKKRFLCALLAITMVLGMTACSGGKTQDKLEVKEGIPNILQEAILLYDENRMKEGE
mgnify:CR=1 FL=1